MKSLQVNQPEISETFRIRALVKFLKRKTCGSICSERLRNV